MDPVTVLSVTASLIACLQLTGTLLKRFGPSDHSKEDLKRILKTIEGFQDSCNDLKLHLEADPENEARLSAHRRLDEPLRLSKETLTFLHKRLDRLDFIGQHVVGIRWDAKLKKSLQRLDEAKDLLKLARCNDDSIILGAVERYIRNVAEDVRDLKTVINENGKRLLDHSESVQDLINEYGRYLLDLGEDVRDIKIHTEEVRSEENQRLRDEIFRWLCDLTTDPHVDHNVARAKCEPETGAWFIHGEEYRQWKEQPSSFLWLHSIPGGGKTILCSTIIQDMLNFCGSQPYPGNKLAAFFYCSFTESKKQRVLNLVCSFLLQLAQRTRRIPRGLVDLYNQHKYGQPKIHDIKMTLRSILEGSEQSFLFIDALDEGIDETGTRREILTFLTELSDWALPKVHILITSRKEADIEKSLTSLTRLRSICILTQQQKDIEKYVKSFLTTDSVLKKWSAEAKEEIQDALTKNSNGMFRWVFCQLNSLRKCLRPKDIRQSLKSLPKDLDETYARILLGIDDSYRQLAFTALQWLAFSEVPLKTEELAEAAIINPQAEVSLDLEDRFQDSDDILTILSSLVTVSTEDRIRYPKTYPVVTFQTRVIKLAHFSVKEYLISERIQAGPAGEYSIREIQAHTTIAEGCLAYLLQFDTLDSLTSLETLDGFPLLEYAARYWFKHARVIEENCKISLPLSDRLLWSQKEALNNWVCLYDLDYAFRGFFSGSYQDWQSFNVNRHQDRINHPLYYATLADLRVSVKFILDKGANVNAQGRRHGTALHAAAYSGHETISQLLLDKGADVNAQGGYYGTVLQAAAAERDHKTIVQLLIDRGANVNAQGGEYDTALQAAAAKGHETMVQLLIDKGANVNAQGGYFGTALQAAAAENHKTIVQLLIDKGANVNALKGNYCTALQAAAYFGHKTIVQLLIDKKANVNAQGGYYDTALQAAAAQGRETIVQLLIDKEANVNVQNEKYGTALQTAAYFGHETIVQLLLDKGANVNAQGGIFGTALQAATKKGRNSIVELLLDNGAVYSEDEDSSWEFDDFEQQDRPAAVHELEDSLRGSE